MTITPKDAEHLSALAEMAAKGLAISGREGQPADPTLLQDRRSVEVIRRFNELPEKAKNSVSQLIFSMRNILVEGSPK
jgi:hypothetical protein